MKFSNSHLKNQKELSKTVFQYYNIRKEDRNFLQAKDGYVHHHFGLGSTLLDSNESNQEKIMDEIQRLENELSDYLIKKLQLNKKSEKQQKIIDLGCGRGGNMFRLIETYPNVLIEGINITEYQAKFCQTQIFQKKLQNSLKVIQCDFLNLPNKNETFTHAFCCETTQYVLDLNVLFKEVYRVLQKNGTFVIATWCFNDNLDTVDFQNFIEQINDHYGTTMHGINEYKKALTDCGFEILSTEDKTKDAIPYWELRSIWNLKSGIENCFIENHKNNKLNYYFIVANKK